MCQECAPLDETIYGIESNQLHPGLRDVKPVSFGDRRCQTRLIRAWELSNQLHSGLADGKPV